MTQIPTMPKAPVIRIREPLRAAWANMRAQLFEPFVFKKWLALGFCAFLSQLASGGGGSFNFNTGSKNNTGAGFPDFAQHPWIIALVVFVVLFVLALMVLCWWLGARGTFMFLDGVVHNRALVRHPWREFRREGNRYFLFLVAFGLATLAAVFSVIGLVLLALWSQDWNFDIHRARDLAGLCVAVAVFVSVLLAISAVYFAVNDFVAPLIYLHRTGVRQEAGRFFGLLTRYPSEFGLYLLLRMGLGLLFIVVVIVGICLTCCLAALPYVSSVVFLPAFVLVRAYPLHFLAQFGPEWDVFRAEPTFPHPPPLPVLL